MDPNVALPFLSSALRFVFFVFLIDQWRERRRPYQLIWAIGMLWCAIEVFREIRVPFTRVVVHSRRAEA